MMDLDHQWGGDLSVDAAGDLQAISGESVSQQRIIRRLLTLPASYIWNPTYGAGLGRFVGTTTDKRAVQALVKTQIRQETAVADDPRPVVVAEPVGGTGSGTYKISITYRDRDTDATQTMLVPVGI